MIVEVYNKSCTQKDTHTSILYNECAVCFNSCSLLTSCIFFSSVFIIG